MAGWLAVVQQLTKAGFITPLETKREGQRPERTVYALTDAGRHELRDWLRELIAEQRAQIRALIDRTLATGVPELFLVEEDYRLALLEAESSFVQRLIAGLVRRVLTVEVQPGSWPWAGWPTTAPSPPHNPCCLPKGGQQGVQRQCDVPDDLPT